MSSFLSGGGRAYGLDLEIVKSSSTSSRTSHSSSPSSTLSESSNSPLSTRKPRTPRKRPNQTYNEAAAILSTAYPKIFSTKHLTKTSKFTKPYDNFFNDSSELLLPFRVIDDSGFLLHQPIQEKPNFRFDPKAVNSYEKACQSPAENDFQVNSSDLCDGYEEDFDAESILDEEIEEGIDSIMGNLSVNNDESNANGYSDRIGTACYGHPLGLGFGGKFDFGFGMRALRNVDEGEWWKNPTVDVLEISPKFNKVQVEKKKKKKRVELKSLLEIPKENSIPKSPKEDSMPNSNCGLLLKLNYDDVLNAWSDRESPFSDETPGSNVAGNDVHVGFSIPGSFSIPGKFRS